MIVIIFDWDGTIVDSMRLALKEFQDLAKEYFGVDAKSTHEVYRRTAGGPPQGEMWRQIISLSKRKIEKKQIDKIAEEMDELMYQTFLKGYEEKTVFNEVPQVLSELKKNGYELCISSGGAEPVLKRDAKAKGLDHFFTFILGSRDGFRKGKEHFDFISKKFNVEPKEMVFIGDGPYDMKVGKEYGCFTIGRIGTLDRKTLLDSGADTVLKDFQQLVKTIEEKTG